MFSFSISVEALAAEAEDDTSVGTVHYSVLSFQGLEKVLNITHTLFTKVSSNDQRHSLLKFMYRKSHVSGNIGSVVEKLLCLCSTKKM